MVEKPIIILFFGLLVIWYDTTN